MRKKILLCIATLMIVCGGCGENDSDKMPEITSNYSAQKGQAEGKVDFTTETPVIELKNISTYLGEDIDYSSGIEVENTDRFEDFQMWVDASMVDIYTEGTYDAVYRFIYDGNSIERTIKVTVLGRNEEPAGDTTVTGGENNGNTVNNENSLQGAEWPTKSDGNSVSSGSAATSTQSTNNQGATQSGEIQTTNKVNTPTTGPVMTTARPVTPTTKPTAGNTTAQSTTPKREIITSSGTVTMKGYTSYVDIELLSGSVVKIKCTAKKYIVSTRTDVSETVKNGIKYNVYKLVITYNTGAEQILETYEEKQA